MITPLSWPEGTHFGGPPVYDSPAAREATYAHSLVHRREAFHVGEFGTGWQNSAFWSGSTSVPDELSSLLLQQARYATDAESVAWCNQALADGWRPSELNKLCAAALQGKVSETLHEFAATLAEAELRGLIDLCLERCGFELEAGTGGTELTAERPMATEVDTPRAVEVSESSATEAVDSGEVEMAIFASRRISSAHLERFAADGSVVLRRLLPDEAPSASLLKLVAAAVAAKLHDAPACRIAAAVNADGDVVDEVTVVLAGAPVEVAGVHLAQGDALVIRGATAALREAGGLVFQACTVDDANAAFVDPLYAAGGSAPTSVLQWSKGSIY